MLYTGGFSDINGKNYSVEITTGTSREPVQITFSGDPCQISSSSDGLFSPIKSRQCTLSIVSDSYIMDLYQTASRGAGVIVRDDSNNGIIFRGYLTPNVYDQDYTYLDTIQIECRDAVSTLQDFKFQTKEANPTYRSFADIIMTMLRECGYTGHCYVPDTYIIMNNNYVDDILSKLYISEANFFEDTEEHKPLQEYEVLEEILKFMNWSLCPFGNDIWIIDYRTSAEDNTIYYQDYDLSTSSNTPTQITRTTQVVDIITGAPQAGQTYVKYAPGTSQLSMDDVYNKIELSDNLYEIEEIAPDIDTKVMRDVRIINQYGNISTITLDQSQWVTTSVTEHWLRPDEVSTDITGYEYQTVALFKEGSGWKHHFYSKDRLIEIDNSAEGFDNCYDILSTTQYKNSPINKYLNTVGCFLQHYAYRANTGKNNLPTSLDWTDYLTFNIFDDTSSKYGNITLHTLDRWELPVLDYEIPEAIMWKPSAGTSWITIKGDLFYQYNGAKYGEKNKQTLNIINTNAKYYTTAPVDKATEIDEQKYLSCYRDYDHYKDTAYGDGFSTWKFKLQIGNKYWNGRKWTSTASTFYIPYNNNPANRGDEYFPAFSWASLVPRTDYTDKVGEKCYAIPIAADDNDAPSFGSMKLTVYVPRIIPKEIVAIFSELFRNDINLAWSDLPPMIYCKDFELGYVYTDSAAWYKQSSDKNDSDVVYTNLISDKNTNEFSDIELKINTQLKDRPISRSYVCLINGYLKTMRHLWGDGSKEQEKNIIDTWYYHFNSPKKVYNCSVHGLFTPDRTFNPNDNQGRYLIDKYTFDVRNAKSQLTLIEY